MKRFLLLLLALAIAFPAVGRRIPARAESSVTAWVQGASCPQAGFAAGDILAALRDNGLTERHGRALLRLPDADSQRAALSVILEWGMTVAAADAYIDGGTFDNSYPSSEQWIGRVEGIGQVKWCENMHITNSVAPAVTGTIDIQ